MTRLLFLLLLTCSPAHAQAPWVGGGTGTMEEGIYLEDPGPDDAWFGRLVVVNLRTLDGTLLLTYESKHGPILIERDVTPNDSCADMRRDLACADTWTVLEVPEGVAASPRQIIMLEGKGDVIYFYEWTGA